MTPEVLDFDSVEEAKRWLRTEGYDPLLADPDRWQHAVTRKRAKIKRLRGGTIAVLRNQ